MTVQLHVNGREQAERACACGCGEPVSGRMKYRPAHRQRAYRARLMERAEKEGFPARLSLRVLDSTHGTSTRNGDAPGVSSVAKSCSRSGPSGVSYAARTADECLARWLALNHYVEGIDDAREEAKRILFPALSARRQRECLQREAA